MYRDSGVRNNATKEMVSDIVVMVTRSSTGDSSTACMYTRETAGPELPGYHVHTKEGVQAIILLKSQEDQTSNYAIYRYLNHMHTTHQVKISSTHL